MKSINLLVMSCLFSSAVYAGSLSDKLQNNGNDPIEKERKQRAQEDIAIIKQYTDMIANVFKEGTPVRIMAQDQFDVWQVRNKLLALSTRKNGPRVTNLCGGRRPWGKNGITNYSYTQLETTPEILATADGKVYEFTRRNTVYEINPAENSCLYMEQSTKKVQKCRFINVQKASEERYFSKHIKEVADHCKRFYAN